MKSRVIYHALLGWVLLAEVASAQFSPGARSAGDPYLPALGNGGYDVQHYDLTINYNPTSNVMVSRADITIRATQGLSEFSLDLRGFSGATVSIDGVAAGVARSGDKLIVTPAVGIVENRVFHAAINYSGVPAVITDPDGSREGWVRIPSGGFVVNEPMGAMGWFPCNNAPADKATYDFHITVPNTHTAIGNGELASRVDNGDGTTTWNWHMGFPMSAYLSTSTVGLFDYVKILNGRGRSGNVLEFYNAFERALPSDQKTQAGAVTGRQWEIIKFISDQIGAPYPYDSAGVVVHRTSLGYALEVQTRPHFSNLPIFPFVLAHEIAHQWFGNSVGPATWREVWFNEGWATWWHWYWDNKQNGNPTRTEQQFTAEYNSTNLPARWGTPSANLSSASQLFDEFPVYTRPAMMLEAYRQIVGDSTFFAFQRALVIEYAYSSISGTQFVALAQRVAQERSGFVGPYLARLDEFFQQWLYATNKPALIPATFFQGLPPQLSIRLPSPNQLQIIWRSTGAEFFLEESDDLSRTSWTRVLSPTATNGQYRVVVVPPTTGSRFYRLKRD